MSALKVTDRMPALAKTIKALTTRQVMVGIPETTTDRKPDGDEGAPPTNAQIGYIQETGAPAANIPPRPFLVPGIASAKDKLTARLAATAQKALDGDVSGVDKGLEGVGLIAQNAVRAKITEGPFVPLKPATLADRKRRGRTGDKPLIDTGQLRRAVTYVVRGK